MAGSLVLGAIIFADFEIPEKLSFGGQQQLVIHSLPGGGRVVDAMGPQDEPIYWSGVFSGQQAAERVRALDQMRRDGLPQLLTFDAWRYSVVLEEFAAQITSSFWIPYRIKLCVLASDAAAEADWLDRAQTPALTIGLLSVAAVETAIGVAGAALASDDVGQAVSAAGNLAQLVTARAYGLFAS